MMTLLRVAGIVLMVTATWAAWMMEHIPEDQRVGTLLYLGFAITGLWLGSLLAGFCLLFHRR